MNTTSEPSKPLLFCLDKSNNTNLKQCLSHFSTRYFTDGEYLIKSIVINKKTEFLPAALILTGDYSSAKEILTNEQSSSIKIFIFCQNLIRQTYEPVIKNYRSPSDIIGLFTTIDDLKDALDDTFMKTMHHRQLIRFITNNLESYLWYEFLKETSLKIDAIPSKSVVDAAIINRQIEYDPLLTLYTLRSPIGQLCERTCACKKIFYGTVIKKTIIERLESNVNSIISFNSFIHLQGQTRALEARHQSLQCCSRRQDEASIIFELELADQPTFKIIRVFNSNDDINLWVVQLIGTHECAKLSKQFSHTKRTTTSLGQWKQPEILFGQILLTMNEIDLAYRYFFQIMINQYEQLSKIYTTAHHLWVQQKRYNEAVEHIATEYQEIPSVRLVRKKASKGKEELTYLESEFDSTWETPMALQDEKKINDLLPPISYRVDHVFFKGNMPKLSTASTRRRCTLL